ncbi:bro-c [Cryptophlebia peltastica nucleopolyhedrovirus]|uniref:Bro-c n=1 Tax=Cryptophlebia peltastica nucleopolyhedrovirus TaxID=2304025 RepID=A0A346RNT9_9ABAC|nr:bro-c [Cryptophlebia peltastica nucleopolyhedrovirus]AXS67736.1 bro-c [Cryptophlebia peltastica nucleopolyhedrovirus]
MSISKIEFVNGPIEVFTVTDEKGENWFQANTFAKTLNYKNCPNAVAKYVSAENQCTYDVFKTNNGSPQIEETHESYLSIQPKTKFINRAGVFELLSASEMPAAKKFKQWNNNDLLPKLCEDGEYNMARDAPIEISEGMNAIHVATDQDGREAAWIEEARKFQAIIKAKEHKIEELTVQLKDSNDKLITFATGLIQANNNLNEANKGLIKANETIGLMANRMADISQDVIAKPSDPQLLHSLAVCAIGGEQYAFLRPQKRSLQRSLKSLDVRPDDIVYQSDYVPNAVNVLNKIKENLPKDKFKARHNRITLLDDLTREQLIGVIDSTLSSRQVAIAKRKVEEKNK